MLTDFGSAGEIATILAAVFAGLLLIWYLMGGPTPLTPKNLRRLFRAIRQWRSRRRQSRLDEEQRIRTQQSEDLTRQIKQRFLDAVHDLLEVMRSDASYHPVELEARRARGKESTLAVLRRYRATPHGFSSGIQDIIIYCHDTSTKGSAIIMWGLRSQCPGAGPSVGVHWFKDKLVTVDDLYPSVGTSAPSHEEVLVERITDADMEYLGWEMPRDWAEAMGEEQSRECKAE